MQPTLALLMQTSRCRLESRYGYVGSLGEGVVLSLIVSKSVCVSRTHLLSPECHGTGGGGAHFFPHSGDGVNRDMIAETLQS